MDVVPDRITFWFGCNMLRHAEMIRLSIMLLERVGLRRQRGRRAGILLRHAHDHQPHAASNMASRTVGALQRGRRKGRAPHGRDLVPVVSHAHVRHHGAGQRDGIRYRAHHGASGATSRPLAPLLTVPVKRRVLLHRHARICHARAGQRAVGGLLRAYSGPGAHRRTGQPRAYVQCPCAPVPGALAKASHETWAAAVARALRHGLHDLPFLPPRVGGAGWHGRYLCPELGAARCRSDGVRGQRRLSRLAQGRRARYRRDREGRIHPGIRPLSSRNCGSRRCRLPLGDRSQAPHQHLLCRLMALLYGPAARCKPKVMIWR